VNDRAFSYASLAAVYLGDEQCDQPGDSPEQCVLRCVRPERERREVRDRDIAGFPPTLS
jgi:hypothetical protein